ncbi:MAG: MBOAT family O-acyltransferase, partial [Ignavibacteria bacterium]
LIITKYLLGKVQFPLNQYTSNINIKRTYLTVSLIILLFFLFVFKYNEQFYNFLNIITSSLGVKYNFAFNKYELPIGISYITFQLISYITDVYYSRIKPEGNIGIFTTYNLFFSKSTSGPIERGGDLLPQIKQPKDFYYKDIVDGVKIIIWGLFKKAVIAERISSGVTNVFANPSEYTFYQLFFTAILLSIQIYCDFSGYTDIALGSAKMLGINLTDNFRFPYFSASISDFWKRWHITLSFWLRDYIFLPIAYKSTRIIQSFGKTKIKPENLSYLISILITMLICGLWHGAKITFILWGILHGLYLLISFVLRKQRKIIRAKIKLTEGIKQSVSILITFILVTFSWILFFSDSLDKFLLFVTRIITFADVYNHRNIFVNPNEIYIILGTVIILFAAERIINMNDVKKGKKYIADLLSYPVLIFLILIIFVFGKFEQSDFLYLKF